MQLSGRPSGRPSGRAQDEMRPTSMEINICSYAEGSCLIRVGNTHVICTATVDDNVPRFLKGKGKGWVTAEYGMLPRSTHSRIHRESKQGKQTGRTQEIQRLIARSLRSITDMDDMGERQIIVDCDVLQADGGTRTASITGGYVALYLAFSHLVRNGTLERIPLIGELAAISCGVFEGNVVTDLDYDEDSNAEVDANFVMTGTGSLVEVQGTAEDAPFSQEQLIEMLGLAQKSTQELIAIQRKTLQLT